MSHGRWNLGGLISAPVSATSLPSGFCPQRGPSLCSASASPAYATLVPFVINLLLPTQTTAGSKSPSVTRRKLSSSFQWQPQIILRYFQAVLYSLKQLGCICMSAGMEEIWFSVNLCPEGKLQKRNPPKLELCKRFLLWDLTGARMFGEQGP